MGVIASWGTKKFEVNPKKIYPFRDFSPPTPEDGNWSRSHAALIFWLLQV